MKGSLASLTFMMYAVGNLIEIINSPTHTTTDPPIVWGTGTVLSIVLLIISFTKYRKYTSLVFNVLVYFVNFNLVLGFAASARIPDEASKVYQESFYLFVCYAVFFVTSQMLDSRRELIAISIFEFSIFAIAVYINRDYKPILLHPEQILMFVFVLIGNFSNGLYRMRLTQISGGSAIQFKSISESARDIQSIVDTDFNLVYINPSIQELSGFKFSDLSGKNFQTLVNTEDHEKVLKALEAIKLSPEVKQSIEYRITSIGGIDIWVESIFSSFRQEKSDTIKLIFIETRDIEVRKKLEAEIHQQLEVEEMLIKFSNQFINVERSEIQRSINSALGEFGHMLHADAVLVYHTHGKLQDEFLSTNQWFSDSSQELKDHFNLTIRIHQQLLIFLRSLRGDKSSHGSYFSTDKLYEIQALKQLDVSDKRFYIIPLQSGNIVNGFVIFVFDESTYENQSSFFGLIGNMVSNAFTRLRTEIRLHEAQMTNESILRALPDWLYIINKEGAFTGTNNYSTLPDYIPDYGLIGRTFSELMPDAIAQQFSSALNEVIDTEIASSFEYQDKTIHQGRFFKVIIAPFKVKEYLIIIRDITELKEAQEELITKAKNLAKSNKELEEFAYIVSHDMKQPIRTVISYLSLLKRKHLDQLTPEAQEFVNFSIDGANKMSDLIRDILQYSRLDQQIELISGNIPLNSIVNKVLKGLHENIVSNNATVTFDELPMVSGNETMLTELFQNLVENGIKYNRSEKKTVNLRVEDNGDFWKFLCSR
ncbi:MAG: PAS domain S-box protein [Bacteroidetes bacterium]|nr:PAS domain S-box protein [Bacteroidota bacterium]